MFKRLRHEAGKLSLLGYEDVGQGRDPDFPLRSATTNKCSKILSSLCFDLFPFYLKEK